MGYKIQSTSHSKQRLRERQNIGNKNQREKLIHKVKHYGLVPENFIDEFKDYLTKKYRRPNTQVKVYEDFIYIIRNKKLITSYKVPDRYLPIKKWRANAYDGIHSYKALVKYLKCRDFDISVLCKDSNGYIVGLVVHDIFEEYGVGATEASAVNCAIKQYLKKNNVEIETTKNK